MKKLINNIKSKWRAAIKYLKGVDHKNYILLALFLISLTLTIIFKKSAYERLFDGFKGFGEAVIALVTFTPDVPGVDTAAPPINIDISMPASIREIFYTFKAFAIILFNRDQFIYFTYNFLDVLIHILKFIIWLPVLIMLFVLIKMTVLKEDEEPKYVESKRLVAFKKFEKEKLTPIYKYFEEWRIFLKDDAATWKLLFMLLILIYYRLGGLIVEGFARYILFIKTFELSVITPIFLSLSIDLLILLYEYNIVSLLVPIIVIFFIQRKNIGRKRLMRMKDYNIEEQASHGISLLITGPPGTGKTEMMTALAFLGTERLIKKALEKIKKFGKMFPNFPWPRFEAYIRLGIEEKHFVNRAQLSEHLMKLYKNDKSQFKVLFDYDLETQKTRHWDGTKFIKFEEAISVYAEAFFLYDSRRPLHFSNYAVVHNFDVEGHFPLYDFDTILMDKEQISEKTAYILNFDAHRIYKKLGGGFLNDDESFIMDGQIETITEVDKERGNRITQAGQKMDDANANQVNDGHNDSIKTIRHLYTIDGTPFVYILMDAQRASGVNADLRELNEGRIEIQSRSQMKMVLPFFELDYLIFGFISNKLDDYLLEFRSLRNDGTLYNYLLNKIAARAGNRLLKLVNEFSYSVMFYKYRQNVTADSAGESSNRQFFMINQITRSRNYATDAYSEYFRSEQKKAKKGFYDARAYKSYRASVKEIDSQLSYWGINLKNMTKTTSNDFEEED